MVAIRGDVVQKAVRVGRGDLLSNELGQTGRSAAHQDGWILREVIYGSHI